MKLSDFQKIKDSGFNLVRIPVGYWAFDNSGSPYAKGAAEYLEQGIQWARQVGVKVIVDLHGAPGSQNGFDNSGRRGAIGWNQGDTITQTMNALNKIVADHSAHPAVAMIEAVNEPMGPTIGIGAVEAFYQQAYTALNTNGVAVTFHDAFETPQAFNEFLPGQPNIVMDT